MRSLLVLIAWCTSLWLQAQEQIFPTSIEFRKADASSWQPAAVPASVYRSLQANGQISDPYQGIKEDSLKWIGESAWEFRLRLYLSEEVRRKHEHVDLVLEGINTYATVWINGRQVQACENQFRTYTLDVTPFLNEEAQEIRIRIEPTGPAEAAKAAALTYTLSHESRVFTRKAAYQYGWDWGPRFIDAGIGRVYLRCWNNLRIEAPYVRTLSLDSAQASLEISTRIFSDRNTTYTFSYAINEQETDTIPGSDKDGVFTALEKHQLKKGWNTINSRCRLAKPKLWWCNGYGPQHLYQLMLSVKGKQAVANCWQTFGVRTIELVQDGPKDSTGFAFRLNGVPVFAKGANLIPDDVFTPFDGQTLLTHYAKDMNMNMLRVWGGGVYPNDAFMEQCDRLGILVWQDLMFACAMYPGDTAFVHNVRQEVEQQVLRLRSHASLALWCGNNENSEGWHNWGWQKQYRHSPSDSARIWNDYQNLFHREIPSVLEALDPGHAYWPSSPSIGWGRKASMQRGDSHYWGVWWGHEPFDVYEQKVPRFMSEYGFQSLPDLSTLRYCCPDTALHMGSACLRAHQKHPTGYETIDGYLLRDLVIPAALSDYVYASQYLQAYGMGKAIEAHRRARPYCMGTLYWQLNDCWPVASWSAIDSRGHRKQLFYQSRRLFAPKLLSGAMAGGRYRISIINDAPRAENGILMVSLRTMDGKAVWTKNLPALMPAAGASVAWSFACDSLGGHAPGEVYVDMRFITRTATNIKRIGFLVPPKDLKLQEPGLVLKKTGDGISISARTLAIGVEIKSSNSSYFYPNAADNFVEVQPGEETLIRFKDSVPDGTDLIVAYSLYDLLHAKQRLPLTK